MFYKYEIRIVVQKKGTTTPELCTLNSNNRCIKNRRQNRQEVRQSEQGNNHDDQLMFVNDVEKQNNLDVKNHLNCIWVKRRVVRTKTNQPELQTLVKSIIIVVNLKLTRNADPTGALHKQEDLLEQFKEVCPL